MLDFGFYNMDCLEGMKQFPDGYFDLAIVDPPYGNALENQGGVQISIDKRRTAASQTERGVMRTGGTWATKYAKKLRRGT